MITFSNLGNYGRLGNQMFQYASIIGIAKKNGYNYCFPLSNKGCRLSEFFNITSKNEIYNGNIFNEQLFSFQSALFNSSDNTDYFGYFQSEKYFEHCTDFIKNEFTFKTHIKEKVDKWFENKEYVSVHVRRGDYQNIQNVLPIISKEWYKEAMNQFTNIKFLFFSDDLDWCKEWFPEHEFSTFENEGEDMYAMTKCKGHIIANSSFSWWGAWLGKGKTIAPKIWFGLDGPQDWQDIYCSDWVIL